MIFLFSGGFPEGIGRLNNLQTLYVSYNKLTSPLPPAISNMSSLEMIWLSSNFLSGTTLVSFSSAL